MITHVLKGGNHLDQDKIIPYVEPIIRFCCNRLKNRCDAEDLSGEILGWNTQTPYVKSGKSTQQTLLSFGYRIEK